MRCDSHVHVIGPAAQYPQVPDRHYLAGEAALADLKRAAAARGIERFVIVQPSFYGTDNSATLHAIDALGDKGRGVAVVPPDISGSALNKLHHRGIRGLRINLYSGVGEAVPLNDAFAAMEQIALRMSWHVEVIAPIALLTEHAQMLAASRAPVVIDHYGVYGGAQPATAQGRALLDLLARPHVWIKMSAPYRVSANPLEVTPDKTWLHAILDAAAARCVWGSDWPHTPHELDQKGPDVAAPYRPLSYNSLYDEFAAAVGSAELTERIMTDNPARLYGFAAP